MANGMEAPSPELEGAGQALVARHVDWWRRKGMLYVEENSAPLGDLWLPLSDGTIATKDLDVTPDMLDVDRIVGDELSPGPLEMRGDLFQARAPYSRVPWVEALLGCPIRATIQGGSMRTQAFIRDWDEWESKPSHRDDGWLDKLKEITETLAQRSGGRYAVSQTLMRGPTDLAEAVLGPELMSLSLYDTPAALRRFLDEATDIFIEVLHAQLERTPRVEGGYVNPFGVWAPGTVVRTQCDASAILSPKQYAEWYLPYDERICRSVDFSMIHLHSCSMHTVDALLQAELPHGIQVTVETGTTVPTLEELVPIFRKILAHKPLNVSGHLPPDKVKYLLEELPHDGLYISARRSGW